MYKMHISQEADNLSMVNIFLWIQ